MASTTNRPTRRSPRSSADTPNQDQVLKQGLSDEVLDGLAIEGDITMIGIHARRQNAANRDRPQLVLIAVALHAPSDPTAQWRVEMYSDNQGWQPYAQALAEFHAGPIGRPKLGRHGDKASATRLYVESVLSTVGTRRLIIFAGTVATRTIWSGLQNSRLGSGALPAITLPNANEISIVRCNTGSEVPRPVSRSGGRQPTAPGTPAVPDRYVYKLADTETPVWLFPKSSRSYRAKGGRIGAHYTPWTLPTELNYLLAEDWHSYTGTEITVVQPGRWKASELAVLTARLCDHTVAWDDRTNLPIPLHLATRADQTHPDYRTDDEEDSEA